MDFLPKKITRRHNPEDLD